MKIDSRQTLLVVKPDAVRRKLLGEIIRRVEVSGFDILDIRLRRLTRDDAGRFYAIHRGKDFYPPLIDFMTSGPIVALLLERNDACAYLREVVGATDPSKARPGTIRADFGTTVRENVVHASNPDEDPDMEIRFYFDQKTQ